MKNTIKNLLGKIVYCFLKVLRVNHYLDVIKQEEHYAYCKRSSVCGNNVAFSMNTTIWNLQNNSQAIQIGDNSIVEGELQVLGYGGKLQIGKNCYIGRDTKIWSGELIMIGDDVLISHNVGIIDTNSHEIDAVERAEKHKEYLKNGHPLEKGSIQTAPIVIENHAWINFDVIILKGVTIGEGAIVAAGAIVTKNVAPYTMVAGIPAKFVKQLV
jgi:acetyltransferase-like isoleucine patch superfamily enzyme